MRASVAPNGTLRISVPAYTPLFVVRRMIASSRVSLRKLIDRHPKIELSDGMMIGKTHTLVVREGGSFGVRRTGKQILVTLPEGSSLDDSPVIEAVRTHMRTVLRQQAKELLPGRIRHLAESHGFDYASLRFTHASSRWGSCNSKKAISLNIALMKLPFELIDYVLIHELAHTVELNHSPAFWKTVEAADPAFKRHRAELKRYDPVI